MKIKLIGEILLWTAVTLVGIVVLIPAMLYVPFIQDTIKDIAVTQVSKATGWQVQVGMIRLQFPLELRIDDVNIIDHGDTIISAVNLTTGVRLKPLLHGEVVMRGARLENTKYGMTSADSSMLLTARVELIDIDGVKYDLASGSLDVRKALIHGGDVNLDLFNDKAQPAPTDTAATSPFTITVGNVTLEKIRYTMAMMPVIDSLGVEIGRASLDSAVIDLGSQQIDARLLAVDSLQGAYFTPSAEYLAAHPADSIAAAEPDSVTSAPWEIRCTAVRLTRAGGTYAMRGATPAVEGLDMNYLQASNVNIAIDSLYNRGTEIRVPIKQFTADERSGLRVLEALGTFAMDDHGMTIDGFYVSTLLSQLSAEGYVSNDFLTGNPSGKINIDLDAEVGLAEVQRAIPELAPVLSMIPQYRPLEARINAAGTASRLSVNACTVALPRYASVSVTGDVENPMSPDKLALNLDLNGDFKNINFIKPSMLEAEQQAAVNFPPLKLEGSVKMRGEDVKGTLTLALPSGHAALDADWAGRTTDYNISLQADSLPLKALLPLSDLGLLTAAINAQGHGLDMFDPETSINAYVKIDDFEFGKENYHDIRFAARLSNGHFSSNLLSQNDVLNFSLGAYGTIAPDTYDVKLQAYIENIDLQRLEMSETAMYGHADITCDGTIDLASGKYSGKLGIKDLGWTMDEAYYYADAIDMDFSSDSTHTTGNIANGDMTLSLKSPCGIDSLLAGFSRTGALAAEQAERLVIDADTLRDVMPQFDCSIKVGKKNLASQFLESSGVEFNDMRFNVTKDSTFRMTGDIDRLTASGLTIDTVRMYATERNRRISYLLHAANRDNRNGTGIASAGLLGIIAGNRATVLLRQYDFNDSIGVRFGIDATMDTANVLLKLIPEDPIIGYKRWLINKDNHISYNYRNRHFDADMRLQCDSSVVSLTTKHVETGDSTGVQEDILLDISKVQISDWLTFSPLAPPMKGELGVSLKVKFNGESLWGDGVVNFNNFYFNKKRVGDFTLNSLIDLDPQTGGTNIAAALEVNGRQSLIAYGAINDTTTANVYDLWIELDRFPLAIANPFMPPNVLNTTGYLNGMMSVSGASGQPLLNGYLQCDSTYINVPVFSTSVNLPGKQIPVDSSVIKFDDYSIKMLNDNPLVVNGTVDMSDLADMGIDLAIRGQNVQFVNSSQTKKAELFGRGFANLDATMRGTMNDLDLDATVSILSGTNITYVMPTDVNTLTQQNSEQLVTFVQFSDSTTYVKSDSLQAATTSSMNLTARLNIMQGSHVNVFLSNNGSDRAEIEGSGNLTFALNRLGDMTMTGRYTINNGFVRYNPPLISQVLFNFKEGSFIQFNGEIMNPVLNLTAVQTTKANVTQEGQDSRLVDFLISLSATNTLSDMDVQFDLSTNSDVTVQNELQSMSQTQRSAQAMNLLLYGTYTGPSTSASSNLASNQLYSFLQSKLNSWAANNIKGIDLSFGIDQYDQTVDGVTSSTMRYSYQVSKSLFNDRFKIVVGGNYSPDMTGENEIAQSLFNDVSLEYALTPSGSMYVRLFNKSGYESILEGEVTQTGVGFVISRKLPKLRYLFNFGRPRRKSDENAAATDKSAAIKEERNDTTMTKD